MDMFLIGLSLDRVRPMFGIILSSSMLCSICNDVRPQDSNFASDNATSVFA